MANPVRPEAPHWLHYTMQFKDPTRERALAVNGIANRETSEIHSYDIPLFLKNEVLRKVLAVFLWAIGFVIIPLLVITCAGSRNKTRSFTAAKDAERDQAVDSIPDLQQRRTAESSVAISRLFNHPNPAGPPPVNAGGGAPAPAADDNPLGGGADVFDNPISRQNVINGELQLVANFNTKSDSEITIQEISQLSTLAFNIYSRTLNEDQLPDNERCLLTAIQSMNLGKIANVITSFSDNQTIDRDFFITSISNLLYICQLIENQIDPEGRIAGFKKSLLASLNKVSHTDQTITYLPSNQANFENTQCQHGQANSSCGSIALAALLDSTDPIGQGFNIHRQIKGDGYKDYADIDELRHLPGVNNIETINQTPESVQLTLQERYKAMLDQITLGEGGILQVSGLYIMVRKAQNGQIQIFDSHGSQSATISESGNINAYSAQFNDVISACLFLCANIRPPFEVENNNIIAMHKVNFFPETTALNITEEHDRLPQIEID